MTDDLPTATAEDCNDDGLKAEQEIIKVHNGFDKMFINNAVNNITFQFSGRVVGPTTFNVGHDSDISDIKKYVKVNRVGRIRSTDYP